jgi:hypothetical protein
MRPVRLLTFVALVAAPIGIGAVVVGESPAEAGESDVCKLVTRKEASDLLGAKVVKTTTRANAANGAEECTYRTKKKGIRNLKLQLELTIQPVTDELRSKLRNIPFDDGGRLQGLGDEAYVDKFDSVVAVSGTTAVQAKLQNYQGASSRFRRVSEGAVRAAVPRLAEITPPST